MFVAFRTDANPGIGIGHLMRCLALADALAADSARCLFICREQGLGKLAEHIRQAGHELFLLPEGPAVARDDLVHSAWLPHGQIYDAAQCSRLLAAHSSPDWLVVDHYALDQRWESALRPVVGKILIIDDLADRQHDCDALLDQNLRPDTAGNPYSELTPDNARHFLGPRHALLRQQFFATGQAPNRRPPNVLPHLLVMFGGADQADLTGRTVDILGSLALAATVEVVIGPLYAHRPALEKRLQKLSGANLRVAPDDIAEAMLRADVAIASPGGTSWERCASGLPSLTIAVADNQMAMAEALALRGAHLFLGRAGTVSDAELAAAIHLLTGNRPLRQHMAQQAAGITDGQGSRRLAEFLTAQAVSVRRARPDDAHLLHRWRDDPRVRQNSFDPRPIPWDEHLAWFEKALTDPAKVILVGQTGAHDFGCVRFDLNDHQARISIYLDPDCHGHGLAAPLLRAADAWLQAERPDISLQVAEIVAGNAASRRAFLGAGYHLDHSIFVKRG